MKEEEDGDQIEEEEELGWDDVEVAAIIVSS